MNRLEFLTLLVGAPIAAKLLPETVVPRTVTIPAMELESTQSDMFFTPEQLDRIEAVLYRRAPIHPAHARALERIGYPYS